MQSDYYRLAYVVNEILEVPFKNHYPKLGLTVVRAMCKVIAEGLSRGEDVSIRGFGTFRVKHTPFRNMPGTFVSQTTTSPIPIRMGNKPYVVFEPSIQLMAMLNQDTPNFKEQRAVDTWKL